MVESYGISLLEEFLIFEIYVKYQEWINDEEFLWIPWWRISHQALQIIYKTKALWWHKRHKNVIHFVLSKGRIGSSKGWFWMGLLGWVQWWDQDDEGGPHVHQVFHAVLLTKWMIHDWECSKTNNFLASTITPKI